jgi:hypothetical protein
MISMNEANRKTVYTLCKITLLDRMLLVALKVVSIVSRYRIELYLNGKYVETKATLFYDRRL